MMELTKETVTKLRITVKPGAKLSLQMHYHRSEHWIVVSGSAKVTNGKKTYILSKNESTYIPQGAIHALENPGKVDLELIEVQSGSYLGEDDIVRFEDRYGEYNVLWFFCMQRTLPLLIYYFLKLKH